MMFNEKKFLSNLQNIDTSENDITYAEIKAIANVLHNSTDHNVGLYNVINYAFTCGFQKGQQSCSCA